MAKDKDLQKIFDFYEKHMPKTSILVKNKDIYDGAKQAIQDIADFVWESDPDAAIDVQPDALTGTSASMTIIANELIFDDMEKFSKAISKAQNFEIYPRTDGKISVNFVFNHLYSAAPPKNK